MGIIERYTSSAGYDNDDEDEDDEGDYHTGVKSETQQPADKDGSHNDHPDNDLRL